MINYDDFEINLNQYFIQDLEDSYILENYEEYVRLVAEVDGIGKDDDGWNSFEELKYFNNVVRAANISEIGMRVEEEELTGDYQETQQAIKSIQDDRDKWHGKALNASRQLRETKRKLEVYTSMESKELRMQELRRQSTYSLLDRIPPQNIGLEQTLLGTYLLHPELMEQFNQPYINIMLYSVANKEIHLSMMDLNGRLEMEVLMHHLKKHGRYEAVGGEAYLREIELFGGRGNIESVKDYIEIIEECYLRRQIVIWSTERIREAYDNRRNIQEGKNETEVIHNWVEHLRGLAENLHKMLPYRLRRNYSKEAVVNGVVEEFEDIIRRGGTAEVSSGYKRLDDVLHGIPKRRLIILGATSKTGKSTVAVNIADNVAEQGAAVLYFPYEEPPSEIVQKLICKRLGINTTVFEYWDRTTFPVGFEDNIRKTAEYIKKELPIYYDSVRPASLDHIIARTNAMKASHPELRLVVVDGLNSFPSDRSKSRSDSYYNTLSRLKDLANEAEICVLINAQLNKDAEGPRKRPSSIEQLADCKGIGDVADNVLFLYRPEKRPELSDDPKYAGWIEVIPVALRKGIEKDRNFRLRFERTCARVSDYE